jgi:2-dehydro-3-deoxyphosphogluconate aldolase/(4S)-4-hydroxy-2-oxoglutarate aldolase
MNQQELFEKLSHHGVIPVIAIESVEDAIPMADAMIEGGLPVAEITFRTAAGGEVIAKLKKERPNLLLGAGTILSLDNLKRAKDAGALFGVAPGLNPEIMREAKRLDLPFVPGVMTPSEVDSAMNLGAKVLKFFPSEAAGGLKMIEGLYAPFKHMGVKFMPTGGVSMGNLEAYLSNPAVMMVGGTWIAKNDVIAAKKWDVIRDNCAQAVELVRKVRASKKSK